MAASNEEKKAYVKMKAGVMAKAQPRNLSAGI